MVVGLLLELDEPGAGPLLPPPPQAAKTVAIEAHSTSLAIRVSHLFFIPWFPFTCDCRRVDGFVDRLLREGSRRCDGMPAGYRAACHPLSVFAIEIVSVKLRVAPVSVYSRSVAF